MSREEDIQRLIVRGSRLRVEPAKESRGFCPTGKGGGIDNSCGEGGGGGGAKIKKKDLKPGMKVSIQKKNQKKVTTGTIVSISNTGKGKSVITFEDGTELKIWDQASITEATAAGSTPSVKKAPKQPKPSGKFPTKAPDESKVEQTSYGDMEDRPNGWDDPPDVGRTKKQEKLVERESVLEAIDEYTGEGYKSMNKALREKKREGKSLGDTADLGKKRAAAVAALDSITQVEGKQERVVYRGISSEKVTAQIAKTPVGGTFVDRAFGSTTTEYDIAAEGFSGDGGAMIKITTKYGCPVDDVSSFGGEAEVLLPRNLRYRVKSKKWMKDPVYKDVRLYVEVEAYEIAVK